MSLVLFLDYSLEIHQTFLYNPRKTVCGAAGVRHEAEPVELGTERQNVSQLTLYLYRRALHPELFRIHASKHLQQKNYQANIWIVGLGHVVTMHSGGRVATEAIIGDTDLLPDRGLANHFRFRGERDHQEEWDNGVNYMISSQIERMSKQLFQASHADLLRHARRRGMMVSFDEWTSNGDLVPFSFIDYEARERELHISAFHVYPEELTFVKTQSIIELLKVAPPRVHS